jgi:hypothetical protein
VFIVTVTRETFRDSNVCSVVGRSSSVVIMTATGWTVCDRKYVVL